MTRRGVRRVELGWRPIPEPELRKRLRYRIRAAAAAREMTVADWLREAVVEFCDFRRAPPLEEIDWWYEHMWKAERGAHGMTPDRTLGVKRKPVEKIRREGTWSRDFSEGEFRREWRLRKVRRKIQVQNLFANVLRLGEEARQLNKRALVAAWSQEPKLSQNDFLLLAILFKLEQEQGAEALPFDAYAVFEDAEKPPSSPPPAPSLM